MQLGAASFVFLLLINCYTFHYVVNYVQKEDAEILVKLKRSKVEQMKKDYKKWLKRRMDFEQYLADEQKKRDKHKLKWQGTVKVAARLGSGESDDVNSPLMGEEGGQIELVALRQKKQKSQAKL